MVIDQSNLCQLLWIAQHRSEVTIKGFFTWFTAERSQKLEFVCLDMWKPYHKIIARLEISRFMRQTIDHGTSVNRSLQTSMRPFLKILTEK
ncbi:MAG: transposase [Chitinophagaceae bacterium]|nr:transposase [Oligoflexus sp.]